MDADYVVLSSVPLETKLNIVEEFRQELSPEVIDTKHFYAYNNKLCASTKFRRAAPKGMEWLTVLLKPEGWKAELEMLLDRFE